MAAFGLTLIVMAVVLLLAEAHLSTGGLIGACASVAAIAGVVVLLLAAGAGAVTVLIVALCVAGAFMSLLLLLSPDRSLTNRAPGFRGAVSSGWAWRIGVAKSLFPSSGGSPCGCSAMAAISR